MLIFTPHALQLEDRYMHDDVVAWLPFLQSCKDKLITRIDRLVTLYTKCVTSDDPSVAVQQLKIYRREHIAWECNTVLRQMLAQERRGVEDPSDLMSGGTLIREEEAGIVDILTLLSTFALKWKGVLSPRLLS